MVYRGGRPIGLDAESLADGDEREWCVDRDFDAIELTIVPGEVLEIELEESGFLWVRNQKGELGWVPGECLSFADRA